MTLMGLIEPGDEDLHMQDSSHRWTAPAGIDQDVWEACVRAHLLRHAHGEHGQARTSPRDGSSVRTSGPVPPPTS